MSSLGELDSVLSGDWMGSPFWSVDELGRKSWALTPSSRRDQGINDTQVKALLEVLENGSLKSEGLSSEGQPCQQSRPGEIFPDQYSKIFLPSLFFLNYTVFYRVAGHHSFILSPTGGN